MDRILTLFSQAWLCLAVGASAQVFTSYPAPACGDPTISVSSAENKNSIDNAGNLLTRSEVEVRGTFWLAPDKALGSFVVDLGCKVDLQTKVREVFTMTEKAPTRIKTMGGFYNLCKLNQPSDMVFADKRPILY